MNNPNQDETINNGLQKNTVDEDFSDTNENSFTEQDLNKGSDNNPSQDTKLVTDTENFHLNDTAFAERTQPHEQNGQFPAGDLKQDGYNYKEHETAPLPEQPTAPPRAQYSQSPYNLPNEQQAVSSPAQPQAQPPAHGYSAYQYPYPPQNQAAPYYSPPASYIPPYSPPQNNHFQQQYYPQQKPNTQPSYYPPYQNTATQGKASGGFSNEGDEPGKNGSNAPFSGSQPNNSSPFDENGTPQANNSSANFSVHGEPPVQNFAGQAPFNPASSTENNHHQAYYSQPPAAANPTNGFANQTAYQQPNYTAHQAYAPQPQASPPYSYPSNQPHNSFGAYGQNAPNPYMATNSIPPGQYYATNWYMNSQPVRQKKKVSIQLKLMLWIVFVIFTFFLVAFAGYCVTAFQNTPPGESSFFNPGALEGYTSPSITLPEEDYSDPNGPSIELVIPNESKSASTKTAYESLSPSVVSVITYEAGADTEDIYGMLGQGTGIIISSNGYIVTNSHVINDSKQTDVYITLKDGSEYPAKTIGFDKRTDIAVLKIDLEDLPKAAFADSDSLIIGEDVVAIGNPGGIDYSNSITRGIVSALDRTVNDSTVLYIQTDAAINPGNSGGPLANLNGQVIGINTIKVVSPEFEGMGFAIPSATIKQIADDLIKQGFVSDRVRIGITGHAITDYAATNDENLKPGISIEAFSDDSPLPEEGAKENDIITHVDGAEINSFASFYYELENYRPDDIITLTIYRPASENNGKEKSFDIQIKLLADNGETQQVETSTED